MISRIALALLISSTLLAQSPEPPLTDKRLTIHTLVREDIFAGLLNQNMTRFERGDANISKLMESRPDDKWPLQSWKGLAVIYRALLAHEQKNEAEFDRLYTQGIGMMREARTNAPNDSGVAAVTGGTIAILGDRLPSSVQSDAWKMAYDAYRVLWKSQSGNVDKLPLHIRGELLAGLAQTSERTGRTDEMKQYLDKIVQLLPGTAYASMAEKWRANPASAKTSRIACQSCHEEGRLSSRLKTLGGR